MKNSIFFCFALISTSAFAQIPGLEPVKTWSLDGYVKYMATWAALDNSDNTLDQLVHQRFNYEYRLSPSLRFNAGMRNRFIWGDSAKESQYLDVISSDDGYMDLSTNWLEQDGRVGNSQFDRLYIDWNQQDWQTRAGRFRINWAMTTIWNPNDVFNTYSTYDFDYEERPGSDAIMLGRQLGFASEADFVFSPNKDQELNSYALRYLFNWNTWDAQVITGRSKLDHFIGAGFAGDILGAGFKGELSYFTPDKRRWNGIEQYSAVISSIESDYSFSSQRNWMIKSALLHHSSPQQPADANVFFGQPLSAKTLSFTHWTGYIEVSMDITPLNKLLLSSIYYQDGSGFIGLTSNYSLADDWQLLAVVQRFDGTSNSLFGENPNTLLFTQLKWNF